MTISVLQENLLRALARTGRVVPLKPQLPIIQNILLSTEEGRLKLTATNLETTETVLVGAKVEKNGGICVSSRLLGEFVSSLPQETVHLSLKDGALLVQCGGFRASIPGVAAEEFPRLAVVTKEKGEAIEKENSIRAVERVLFSAATDEGRPLLTGVRIAGAGDDTTIVATDGYRLSLNRMSLKTKKELTLLIPARALGEVLKVGVEEKSVKDIYITPPLDGQVSFFIGDTEIRTRLIDGEYPNIEKTIPTKHNTRVLLDRNGLEKAVKAASIFARDNANIVRFHVENQTVTISANTPQVGEDQIDIEAKVDGEGGDMAFNSRFLLEFLANFHEEELLFEMTGSLNPGVFRPVKDDSYLHIIMPVRVQN